MTLGYYPFGLKQKGYNNTVSSNGNVLAQAFKYNGVELNESLGLDLYEMDFRMYDPTIGKFNGIDPVSHFSMGTSVAFDNNPILWADPSGADGIGPYNVEQDTPHGPRYTDINGNLPGNVLAGNASADINPGWPTDALLNAAIAAWGVEGTVDLGTYDLSTAIKPFPFRPFQGYGPSAEDMKGSSFDEVSLSIEFASPWNFANKHASPLYGIGFDFGVVEVDTPDNPNSDSEMRGFITSKAARSPFSLAAGISLNFGKNYDLRNEPLTAGRLRGLGTEVGISVLFVGGSISNNGTYYPLRQADYENYSVSIGLGVEGYVMWDTKTFVSGD